MARQTASRRALWLTLVVVAVLLLVAAAILLLRQAPPGAPAPAPAPSPSPRATGPEGLWEVAFTTPLIPDDPSKHRGGIDTHLVGLMDRATRTLDVADYDFDLADVADAMARAARRGVRVRMVTDSDTLDNTKDDRIQAAFKTVKEAGISIVPDGRPPIMHNKFSVVDGEWVETGSWNYTDGDTYRLNNNLAIFRSKELADNYTAEFEKMFVQRRFGPTKPKGVPHPVLQIGPLKVENYFAAEDGVAARVADRVKGAQRTVHFLAFSFTHDGIGGAMIERKRAGLDVQGVFETTGSNTSFSEYGKMKQAGLDVYQDGSPYVMHHKVILLDDRVTIFGSFNFSNNADQDNDENLLVVEDPDFTAQFEREYQRVLVLAKNPPSKKQPPEERTERQRQP